VCLMCPSVHRRLIAKRLELVSPRGIRRFGPLLGTCTSFPMAKKVCLFVTLCPTVLSYHQHRGLPKLGWALAKWEVSLVMLVRLSNTRTRNILAFGAMAVLAGVLFVPGLAAAKTSVLKFVGVQGTSGNQADVSRAGQVLTSPADANSYFDSGTYAECGGCIPHALYSPPSGQAGILTSLHVDAFNITLPGDYAYIQIGNSTCSTFIANVDVVSPTYSGMTIVPYSPGLVIPAGDSLCISANALTAQVSAMGYTVPQSDAPSTPQ
jgi:hypothetical protein